MKTDPTSPGDANLCLECGMCCNGVIFADVRLHSGENPSVLTAAGLEFVGRRLPQPCPAFDGCFCRVYAIRPKHCHEFQCRVLLRVRNGELTRAEGLARIRAAQKSAGKVRNLLARLDGADDRHPLSFRFRRIASRMEKSPPSAAAARSYSRLTVAMHELNFQLSQEFYPG